MREIREACGQWGWGREAWLGSLGTRVTFTTQSAHLEGFGYDRAWPGMQFSFLCHSLYLVPSSASLWCPSCHPQEGILP